MEYDRLRTSLIICRVTHTTRRTKTLEYGLQIGSDNTCERDLQFQIFKLQWFMARVLESEINEHRATLQSSHLLHLSSVDDSTWILAILRAKCTFSQDCTRPSVGKKTAKHELPTHEHPRKFIAKWTLARVGRGCYNAKLWHAMRAEPFSQACFLSLVNGGVEYSWIERASSIF